MAALKVVETVAEVREAVAGFRAAGERIGLVPTMGALHDGHISLVRLAKEKAGRAVVSIFVNPTQFAPGEDFSRYPRTFDQDLARLAEAEADIVYAPAAETMYPDGFATTVSVDGPAKVGLEDAFRPTHFAGVATVVGKLLLQVGPDIALFGEKDYQQLAVVTRMARDLDLSTTIVPGPTLRDPDGLAMSSRNRYLSPEERATAPTLARVLNDCAARIRAGRPIGEALASGRRDLASSGFEVDYLEARHAESLAPVEAAAGVPVRLLAAARLGKTRLIDNLPV